MNKDDLFALAKSAILGEPPVCEKALIGYRAAESYFKNLIVEAESASLGLEVPRSSLALYLRNGFEYSSYEAFRQFPPETLAVIETITQNFRSRYEPLLQELEFKAA